MLICPTYIFPWIFFATILVIIYWLVVAADVVVGAGVGCIEYGGGSEGKSTKLLSKENSPALPGSTGDREGKVGEQISSPAAGVGE